MTNDDLVQFQMRTSTLTTPDILIKLPDLVNTSDLSPQQRNVLETYNQYTKLLDDLYQKKWELVRDKTVATVKKLQIDSIQRQINLIQNERQYFEEEQYVLIKELLVIAQFRQEEEERKKLEEWRKERYSSARSTKSDIEYTKAPIKSDTTVRTRFFGFLSAVSGIVYYIILLFVAIIPIVMINLPFWFKPFLLGIMFFIPATSAIFWIWGLISTITGPQDVFAIIYYILFGILFLPFFVKLIKP